MENQTFQWNDPYEDTQAENVTQGSVDYYNFRWGDSRCAANASGENRADCQPERPDGCCCQNPDNTGCTVPEQIPRQEAEYPIIDL